MTLGENWQQELNKKTDKELLFEALTEVVKAAIRAHQKSAWVSYNTTFHGIKPSGELLQEFAEINDLKVDSYGYSGWGISPK